MAEYSHSIKKHFLQKRSKYLRLIYKCVKICNLIVSSRILAGCSPHFLQDSYIKLFLPLYIFTQG